MKSLQTVEKRNKILIESQQKKKCVLWIKKMGLGKGRKKISARLKCRKEEVL